jgi:hypothetical protein
MYVRTCISPGLRGCMLVRSPISVINVEKSLAVSHNSPYMREFTLGRSSISVISVEKPLNRHHTTGSIRPLTKEECSEGRRDFSEIKYQDTSEKWWENPVWQRLAICLPKVIFFLCTASFSLPPLTVANSS